MNLRQGDAPDPKVAERLEEIGLMPKTGVMPAPPSPAPGIDLNDRYRGSLTWGAAGDALGRPGEARSAKSVKERHGRLEDFIPWRGWTSGPTGTITDDTQLTMCVAESIIEHGRVNPEDFATRLADWLPIGRGKGAATVNAVNRLATGHAWYESGEKSAGNGATMRAAPIGLRFPRDPEDLAFDAVVSAVPTHNDAMAAQSAIMLAAGVAFCVHHTPDTFDPALFTDYILESARCLDAHPANPREPHLSEPEHLTDRVASAADSLDQMPDAFFEDCYSGAFILESFPAAIYCFLRYADDPEEALVVAATETRDSDTIASMAGNFAGALYGADAMPDRWRNNLEFHDELCHLAEKLLAASGLNSAS